MKHCDHTIMSTRKRQDPIARCFLTVSERLKSLTSYHMYQAKNVILTAKNTQHSNLPTVLILKPDVAAIECSFFVFEVLGHILSQL